MSVRLLVGDCRATLPSLEVASVQTCITSPPYFGLRDYKLPPLVWGGDAEHSHVFGSLVPGDNRGGSGTYNGRNGRGEGYGRHAARGACCVCGAWSGSLGLEPTPDLYLEHLVECFRHVRRVLRPDGTCWVILGDSYVSQGGFNAHGVTSALNGRPASKQARQGRRASGGIGCKPKDLLLMPFRVALALQADGWYVRSVIPWLKRNSMPESVTDRPTTSLEYVLLLAKTAQYFWDPDAIRVEASANTHARGNGTGKKNATIPFGVGIRNNEDFTSRINGHVSSRNRRNSDWWFESWQGLLLDEQDDPLSFVVNLHPLPLAHFATFPPKLVEPMIRAGTSEPGCCPACRAPWVRVVERTRMVVRPSATRAANQATDGHFRTATAGTMLQPPTSTTTGWAPTCAHAEAAPVPCLVLDPFAGVGTVGLMTDRLGRDAVLCELKHDYVDMATERMTGDCPLFVDIES